MRRIEAMLFASAGPVAREDLARVVGQGASVDLLIEDLAIDLEGRPYEVAQLDRCRQLIREYRLTHFFDIGANFGLYSVLLADESELSVIHAFEPLPRNAHQLAANLYLNGLDDRVTLHQLALSDQTGELELFVDPHSTGVSTILEAQSRRRQKAYRASIRVQARRFDELFVLRGVRALVKMDVEGAEFMALSGMIDFLAHNLVALQVETTPETEEQVAGFMATVGYRAAGRLGADAYYTNL